MAYRVCTRTYMKLVLNHNRAFGGGERHGALLNTAYIYVLYSVEIAKLISYYIPTIVNWGLTGLPAPIWRA